MGSKMAAHLLLVVVTVVVNAAVEAVRAHHPLLLHQTLETIHCPTVGVTHHLHQAGDHATHVPVLHLCDVRTGRADAECRAFYSSSSLSH